MSQPDLQAVRLPLPSIEDQALAVKRVDSLLALTDRMELRYAAAVLHAKRLAPRILAKAFRGEWLPQDRNDEPAGALLARLAAERSDREHA